METPGLCLLLSLWLDINETAEGCEILLTPSTLGKISTSFIIAHLHNHASSRFPSCCQDAPVVGENRVSVSHSSRHYNTTDKDNGGS